MKSFYRKSLKWNRRVTESKAFKMFFLLTILFGLVGVLFLGFNFIVYVIVPAISLLFVIIGGGQLFIAFGCLSNRAVLEAIFPILFGGFLIWVGLITVYAVLSGHYT